MIDYSPLPPSSPPINALRAISSHRGTSSFTSPGTSDLSADVDFTFLGDTALSSSRSVEVHCPIEQGILPTQLGKAERAERLLKSFMGREDWATENERKKKEFGIGERAQGDGEEL